MELKQAREELARRISAAKEQDRAIARAENARQELGGRIAEVRQLQERCDELNASLTSARSTSERLQVETKQQKEALLEAETAVSDAKAARVRAEEAAANLEARVA